MTCWTFCNILIPCHFNQRMNIYEQVMMEMTPNENVQNTDVGHMGT